MATKLAVIEELTMEQAMAPLPSASAEMAQFVRHWLESFAGYVREVNYASARPLFHPDVLAFGTHNDVIPASINGSLRNGTTSGRRPPTSGSFWIRP
jgi:hypothetical protein